MHFLSFLFSFSIPLSHSDFPFCSFSHALIWLLEVGVVAGITTATIDVDYTEMFAKSNDIELSVPVLIWPLPDNTILDVARMSDTDGILDMDKKCRYLDWVGYYQKTLVQM